MQFLTIKFFQKFMSASVLVLIISALFTKSLFACIAVGDPWFLTEASIDEETLPSGIEVIKNDTNETFPLLINKSGNEFYIVGLNKDGRFYPDSGLPPDFYPKFKLLSGTVYVWGRLPGDSDKRGWVIYNNESDEKNAGAPIDSLNTYGKVISAMGYQNVAIQELPLTSGQMHIIAIDFLKENRSLVMNSNRDKGFTRREIDAIHILTDEMQPELPGL